MRASLLCPVLIVVCPALAQEIPGVSLPGVPSAPPQSFGSDPSSTPRASAASVDAAGLVGLKDPSARETLTLADVLRLADASAADLRIAAERVVQQEANLRRAWAAVLPNLSLNGSWQLACTGGGGGGSDVVSCADRSTQLVDPEALQQQADLLDSLAQVFTAAADASSDAEQEGALRSQAAQLNASADSARQQAQNAKPVVVQPASVFSSSLTMSVPLFNGRAFPLLWNAQDAVDVAGLARDHVKSTLLYSTTRAYHGAVAAKKLVTIAVRQLESATKHKAATAARVEAQTQPPLSLRRAELEELRVKQHLHNARASYQVAIASLGLVLGRDEAFDVVEPAAVAARSTAPIDELSDRAIAMRPDVAAQRRAVDIARRGELDAWMMFVPAVNLITSARATSFTQGFVRDPLTGTVAITATVPLYDGGLRYAAMKDSTSRVREETIRARQLEDRVRAQVRGNARDVVVKENALALSQEGAKVARTAHEQAGAMFDAGVGTALDVSDTSLALFVAQNELARAELDVQLARIGFAYVTGAPVDQPQ
jgi:outer membrane protein